MVEHLAIRGEKWVQSGKLVPRPAGMLYGANYPARPA
jgi:hypothetical protein